LSTEKFDLNLTFKADAADYDTKTKYLSFIKKTYRDDPMFKEATALNQLKEAKEKLSDLKGQAFPQELNRRHRVICSIFDIYPDELKHAVKLYSI